MPISIASCLNTTTPIWVSIIAYMYLGENLQSYDIFALVVSIIGVIIINNPQSDEIVIDSTKTYYSSKDIFVGSVFALGGAFGGSIANICKRIMRKNIHYSISPFFWAVGCTFMSPMSHYSFIVLYNDRKEEPASTSKYDFTVLGLLFVATVTTFFAQVL